MEMLPGLVYETHHMVAEEHTAAALDGRKIPACTQYTSPDWLD